MASKSNVVKLIRLQQSELSPEACERRHDRAAYFFFDMEREIADLDRMTDVAVDVCIGEMEGERVTDDSGAVLTLLRDLQKRVKELRQRYYDHH